MKIFAGLLAVALLLPVPAPAVAGCHFAATRVVGCFPDDADVAALAFQRFRNDPDALSDPSVKDVLAGAGCRVIVSSRDRPFHIFRRGQGQIATLKGYEPVSIVEFKSSEGGNIFSVDSKWIEGVCDEAPAGHVSDEP